VCIAGAFIDDTANTDLTMLVDGLRSQGAQVDSHLAQHDMTGELHVHDLQLILNRLAAKKQVPFAEASAELEPGADETLSYISDQVSKRFGDYPELVLEINGYTDSVGSDATNMQLSLARAERVKDELVARGVAAQQVRAVGFGESNPIASNDTPEGRAQNRRVEFAVGHADGDHMG
jgi:outer membrane protein OmpA-like peptidoglycan-associated protein